MLNTTTRNSDLAGVVKMLETQRAMRHDQIVPAERLRFRDGNLLMTVPATVTDSGVLSEGVYSFRPTAVADDGLAKKVGIPPAYLRTLRETGRTDLYDANANGLLRGKSIMRGGEREVIHAADQRDFLVRTFLDRDGGEGIMRALVSTRYAAYDSLDSVLAILEGMSEAGIDPKDAEMTFDLTDRRMIMRVEVPSIREAAPDLMRGYRSPYRSDVDGTQLPIVHAGFVFSNSEVGNGSWSLTPRIVAEICRNGMVITKDVARKVHLGGVQDEGEINYAADTVEAMMKVVRLKARDAVRAFLTPEYLKEAIRGLTEAAGKEVKGSDAEKVIKVVGQRLGYNQTQQKGILDYFLNGGQMTSGGILNAVTAYAQDDSVSADERFDLERRAVESLAIV